MATKRRKVWVEFGADGAPDWVTDNKGDVLDGSRRFVFVERLPGDVVLSREVAADIRKRLTGVVERGELNAPAAAIDIAAVINALLRGCR